MLRFQQTSELNSYHHTDSLLFQFVLQEFLMTLEEARTIENFMHVSLESKALSWHHKLIEYLVKLAGSELEYMRIFSWIYDSGVLTKLKNYSDLLSQRAEKEDNDYIKLHNTTHKAWLSCLHSVDLLRTLAKHPELNDTKQEDLKRSLLKTLFAIRKLIPDIKKIIPKYADDENVIYFLIRHKESFEKLLGPLFLKNLLKKMFPEKLEDFVIERYKMRGFSSLIPDLRVAVKELES